MYALKNAVLLKEHYHDDVEVYIFYIDMRTNFKGYEEFYRRARELGINFIRGRVSQVAEDSRRVPLSTESGWDRVVNYESQLCGLSWGIVPTDPDDLADTSAAELSELELHDCPELFLLIEEAEDGAEVRPRVFALEEGRFVLAFDREDRLAAFAEGPAPYAALPGRVLAQRLAAVTPARKLSSTPSRTSATVRPAIRSPPRNTPYSFSFRSCFCARRRTAMPCAREPVKYCSAAPNDSAGTTRRST